MIVESHRRASIHTLGCRLNQSESVLIEDRLREAGYTIVPFGEKADLGIINTCTVTGEADAKARKLIRAFIRRNPTAFTAVVGCYSEVAYASLAKIKGIDLILGNDPKLDVLQYVSDQKNQTPVVACRHNGGAPFRIEPLGQFPISRRVNLKIQDGCDFACTYCIVPTVRGRARSRPIENLLEEARRLVRRGAKEIVLTGVNIGTYDDASVTLVDIVERLNKIDGLVRIRISSTEPMSVPEALFPLMNDPGHAVMPHLHLPAQSGSNAVLARMKRRYTREDFLALAQAADRAVRDLCIGTDVMVGFPGESEEEFDDTCRLLTESPIAYAHVFKYSDRSGTAATALAGKVNPKTMNRRSAQIRRIAAAKRRQFQERYLGQVVEVLFEDYENGYWCGYTGNYIRVAARSHIRLENTLCRVKLDRICGSRVIGSIADA